VTDIAAEALFRPIEPIFDPLPPLTVLYDLDCTFCRWTVGNVRRWDRDRALRFRPYQATREQPLLADLVRGRSLGRSLHAVDGAGRVAAAGDAVLAIVALLPRGRSVAALVAAVTPSRALLQLLYRVIERTRGPIAARFGLDGPVLRERNPSFDPLSGRSRP
jgi:predicted DCC family thiol-disulfide oxidoreductase YuxK